MNFLDRPDRGFRMGGRCQKHPLNIIPCEQCALELQDAEKPGQMADALETAGLELPASEIRRLLYRCAELEAEIKALKRSLQAERIASDLPFDAPEIDALDLDEELGLLSTKLNRPKITHEGGAQPCVDRDGWVDLTYAEALDALGASTSWLDYYRRLARTLKQKNKG